MKCYLLISLFTCCCLSCKTREERFEEAYRNSVQWLWNQQSADGAWHSETHAVLRDGRALTPYILYYLLQVPNTVYPHDKESINKAVEFIQKDMQRSITMGKDSVTEFNYPNYSASYALRVLHLTKTDTVLQKIIADYLLDQQFLENRSIRPGQLAYGGWGYGEPDLQPGEFGHVDLSHTRHIAEALIETHFLDSIFADLPSPLILVSRDDLKKPPKDEIDVLTVNEKRKLAIELFLAGAQRWTSDSRLFEGCTSRNRLPYDGGFISSAATLATNKSIPVQIEGAGLHYPSYATATCDGLLALHVLGLQKTSTYKDAVKWLTDHQRIDVIDGLSKDDPEQWYLIMHYYHWAVRAEAMIVAGIDGPWKEKLRKALFDEQLENGSYINPLGGVNKEDDPLMATIFCVQAFTKVAKK